MPEASDRFKVISNSHSNEISYLIGHFDSRDLIYHPKVEHVRLFSKSCTTFLDVMHNRFLNDLNDPHKTCRTQQVVHATKSSLVDRPLGICICHS